MRYLKTITIIGLSLLFVACHKQDMEAQGGHEDHTMMTFEPQMGVSGGAVTRGTPLTDVSQIKDMGVFAYHTASNTWATAGATATSNVMNNQKVERKTDGKWTYAPIKPWRDQYNTFFAYAPYATAANGITVQSSYTGAPTIEYTVPATCVDQPDLMVSARQEDKYLGTVSFEMDHALACVGFKVNGRYDEKITKIAIKGASVSGTLSLDHTAGGVPQWSAVAAATDTEYTSGVKDYFIGNAAMSDVLNVDGYLMMIPQTLGADAKLIVTVDGVDREVSLSNKVWKAGEQYSYNIEIPHDPIIIGYFGGWDEVNKEYTKKLQVDWEINRREPTLDWSNDNAAFTAAAANSPYYGLPNIDILKGLSPDLSNYPAAKYCEDKNKGTGWDKGDDWYLPSYQQLIAIWIADEAVPRKFSLTATSYYYSSTRKYSTNIGHVDFGNGFSLYGNYPQDRTKNHVRCVRDVTP